jgi:LPS O-antigen subunit length determinant protein (WzzB/FepE family)
MNYNAQDIKDKESVMAEMRDEIELMDYFDILWRRKWKIILPTLLCAIVASIITFLLPKKWEVDALVQPSKLFMENEKGILEEFVFVDPTQVASQINGHSYDNLIAAEHNLKMRDFPKVTAESLKDTRLIRISIVNHDVAKATAILNAIIRHLKEELDGKASIKIKDIESQINANMIEKARVEKEIEAFKNKIKLAKVRIIEIGDEMDDTRSRVETLEKEQLSTLKAEKKDETEGLAMLLYSNEIQQSLRYLNTLDELLNTKKIEEEDLNSEIEDRDKKIMQIENTIKNLIERKGMIDFTKVIKEPTSSIDPVSPNKMLIVAVSLIGGFIIFTFLALLREYIERHQVTA